tara:strand:- start:54 stop:338 length:285 start_codon:yes stop_codon:yes gene_type:complete
MILDDFSYYTISINRGVFNGIHFLQYSDSKKIVVDSVKEILPNGHLNPLRGRIQAGDQLIKIDQRFINKNDNITQIMYKLKMPKDNKKIRITFQ